MYPVILYCYDAYCCWCYGFSPVISKLEALYNKRIVFEVISGGMILPSEPKHIGVMSSFFKDTYSVVEATTGVKFGKDFLWHIENPSDSDWFPDSHKPAIAMCVFKSYYPERAVEFASDLQYALFSEGRDLCDDEAYRHLLIKYNISAAEFYIRLKQKKYAKQANEEFALSKQLNVTGYPALFLQVSQSKIYVLANGYTNYDTIMTRLEDITKFI